MFLEANQSSESYEIVELELIENKTEESNHYFTFYSSFTETKCDIRNTRKYPLRGYFLGVLTHTTAWDQLWGGEQTFWFEILSALPCSVAV